MHAPLPRRIAAPTVPPSAARRPLAVACALAALSLAAVAGPPSAAAQGEPAPAAAAPALPRVPPPKDLPRDRPLRAGFLALDGVYGSELVAAYGVLERTVEHTRPGIEVFTVSPTAGKVRTFEGLTLETRYGFADAPAIDILVVPSAAHNLDSDLGNEALIAWLSRVGKSARYVVSLRDGAFLVARAGLLPGRLATTFPDHHDAFLQMFPKLELRRNISFVHDGPILASVGGARSHDAALYLVDHLYGEEVARGVAKGLVLPWPPAAEVLPALVIRYREAG